MIVQDLNGAWQLWHMPEGGPVVADPSGLASCGRDPVAAMVPGNVELDLVRAGLLAEPFFGSNIEALRELEAHEWWYQTEFVPELEVGSRRLELHFDGVDCFATYWLNGQLLGESANMLVEQVLDVTAKVAPGRNVLTVRLASAFNAARRYDYPPAIGAMATNVESLWVRKAPHMYGWDIMCRALSAGLWRGVELRAYGEAEITDLYLATRYADDERAAISCTYTFDTTDGSLEGYELILTGNLKASPQSGGGSLPGDAPAWETRCRPVFTSGRLDFQVVSPKLWWPFGYGDQPLYDVTVRLLRRGQVLATRTETIGIRKVELIRTDITSAEKPGEFLFKVNGVPIFIKGTNWVPLDAFHSRDAAKYTEAIALAKDVGCNMLRCWGGNVYEDHAFFDLCDSNGLLVWQDFAMACARYPQDPAFQAVMKDEVTKVVCKLRNHPSLALWCGDNECDDAYNWVGMPPSHNYITRQTAKEGCFANDPFRPYLPSSPYHSPDVVARGSDIRFMPEQHVWGPRDYFKSSFYAEHTAHFVSEIGYHGCPNVSSMRRFLDADKLWPYADNDQWSIHATDPVPGVSGFAYRVNLMADQVREFFGQVPTDLETFVIASQISQAEAKKFFIEMTRVGKWRRTGLIWWNILDGWPQFSDAVVDYYMSKKLAYHYIRRSQEPVCIMMGEPKDWHCRVVLGNDSRRSASGEFRVWDVDTGEVRLAGRYAAPPNASQEIGRIKVSHGEHRLFFMEWDVEETGQAYGNHYCLGKPPFSLDRYLVWLEKIARLPSPFPASQVGK